jgi:multiple antibiotic resistance protein
LQTQLPSPACSAIGGRGAATSLGYNSLPTIMPWTDFTQLTGAILVIVGAILPVVNPPGDAPIFLRMTFGCDDATRKTLARHIALYSFALLLGSMLIGSFVLRMFDLSIPVVQVAGGAVVCALGWNLLNDDSKPPNVGDATQASVAAMAQSFYPLTMPLTVDPGVMSVAVTLGANHAHTLERVLIQLLAAIIGAAIVAVTVLFTYGYAERFAHWIGHRGMMIVLRLSAFIVLSIGVQIAWNGVKTLLVQVGIPTPTP